ncbi:MAG: hypothetical protein CSA45_03845 [Gammaproteobacteria bacterium]|nr:MAG: hypothetical protein CSA45_03845 [Gammaproteobacteria bacterium]
MQLDILYRDDYLVVVNKPAGLLVHRSAIDKQATTYALQLLRDQIGQRVYPAHRLDKPTSGALLFALDKVTLNRLSKHWCEVEKYYLAITRGIVNDCFIDHDIVSKPDRGDRFQTAKKQSAQTTVNCLVTTTLPVAFSHNPEQYPTTSFSIVEAIPKTGRKHQIRKHLKHIHHPIVGDTRYGRGEINRYFRKTHGIRRLMLHCWALSFRHPFSKQKLAIHAPLDSDWQSMLTLFPETTDFSINEVSAGQPTQAQIRKL